MKKLIRTTTSKFSVKSYQRVDYLRTGNIIRKPLSDQQGIHCTGNKLGYIVDWQVSEQKRDDVIAP